MRNSILGFVRRLARRSRIEDDLRDEIQHHLSMRTAALVEEGMPPEDAARQAKREFGNVGRIGEQSRDAWVFTPIESLLQDVRYGVRLLARSPFFSLVAVGSIASGLTAALGIFTVTNATVFRPLGVAPASPIYRIYTADRDGDVYGNTSFADYRDFSRASNIFASTCATRHVRVNMTVDARAEVRTGEVFTRECFAVLGIKPHVGRVLNPSATPASPEVVIGYPLWLRRFHGSEGAIGQRILLNGISTTVVGVAPRGFNGTSLDGSADFWVDVDSFATLLGPRALTNRGYRAFVVLAQLREGTTRAQAEAALGGIATSLNAVDPNAWTDDRGNVRKVTVADETAARFAGSPGALPAMLGGAGAVILGVLAIACVNVATLLLARGASRTRELTIRLAIGASRARVLRQLTIESLVMAGLGSVVAVAIVAAIIRVAGSRYPEGVPAVNLALDWRVVAFGVLAAVIASLMFGLAPGLHIVKLAISDGLKGRAPILRSRRFAVGARELLIVVQVAASVALLLAAGLFADALTRGNTASPGFQISGVTTIGVDLATEDEARMQRLTAAVRDAGRRTEGVESMAIAAMLPLIGSSLTFGDVKINESEPRTLEGNVVSPGYFSTLRIPLRQGRDFSETDRAGTRPVAIASETLARTAWQSTDVVGRTILIDKKVVEIVGVVADTRYRAIAEPFRPVVYVPVAQWPTPHYFVHVRAGNSGETATSLERAIRAIDPTLLVDAAMPLSARYESLRVAERITQTGAATAGAVQLALVLMALWALVSYAVERRKVEIGIRMALGATGGTIVRLVARPAMALIAVGSILGAAAGIVAAMVLQSTFVGLNDLQPLVGIPVVVGMAAIALAAALVPARRAARVQPVEALRAE
jgi:predicted permease